MRLTAWASLSCLLTVSGCAEAHLLEARDGDVVLPDGGLLLDGDVIPEDGGAPEDGDVRRDGDIFVDAGVPDMSVRLDGSVDAGSAPDQGVDAGPPPPECSGDDECDDDSECTTDSCEDGQCVNFNPLATCERFEGAQCAGDLATELLTIEQTFCIPGFAINNPTIGNVSLCQGMRCRPSDTRDGCLITFESMGLPSSEPAPDVLRVQGRITRIGGSVPFTGTIPNPIGGGGTIPLSCNVTFGVGSGLPLSADLVLEEQMMCGTERDVSTEADVDLSMLTIRLSGTGFNAIICGVVNSVIAGQVSGLLGGLEPALETGLNAGLDRLDCGTCDTDCPADLTCVAP